ncbi:uncharacterized protein LOC121381478 [Gigantopelta aegis]|uniref:uncharacterized protein LOC121381478 n=1 Tax=Gigantopelta aegis TaxID=1735272 RepID=UPI001B88C499|nr:uncharacterized protein LOC121381478 [Gigantopelta aegis]
MDAPVESVDDKAPRKPPHNKEAWIQATDPPSDDSQQDTTVHSVTVPTDITVVPSDWLDRTPSSIQNVWQAATASVQVWPSEQSPRSPGMSTEGVDLSADVLPVEKQWVDHAKVSPQPPILKRMLSDHSSRQQSSFQTYIKPDSSLHIQEEHVKVPSPPQTLYSHQEQMMESVPTDWTEGSRVYSSTNAGTYSTSSIASYPTTSSGPYPASSRPYAASPGPYTSVSVSYPTTISFPSTEQTSLLSMEKAWSTVPQNAIFKTGNSSPQVSVTDVSYLQPTEASPGNHSEWVIPSSTSAYKDIHNSLASAFVNPKDGNDTMWVGLSRHGLTITPEQEQLQEYFSRNAGNVIREGDKKDPGLIWNQNIANDTNCEVYSESLDGLVYDKRPNAYPQSVNISLSEKSVHKNQEKDSLNLQVPESGHKMMSTAGTQTMYTLPKVQYIHVHPPKSAAQKVAGQILLSSEAYSSNHKTDAGPNQGAYNNHHRMSRADHVEVVHHGTTDSPQPVVARTSSELQYYPNVGERIEENSRDRFSLEALPRKITNLDSSRRDFLTLGASPVSSDHWQQRQNVDHKTSNSINEIQQNVESQKTDMKPKVDVDSSDEDEDDKSSDWSQSSDEDADYLSSICSICGKQLIKGRQDKSEICNTCKLVRSAEKTAEDKLSRSPRNKHGISSYKSSLDELKAENKRGRKSCKPKKLWVQSSVEEMSVAASAAAAEDSDLKPQIDLVIPKEESSHFDGDTTQPAAVNSSRESEPAPVTKRRRGRPRKSEYRGRGTVQKQQATTRLKSVEKVDTVKDEDTTSDDEISQKNKQGKRKSVWRCRLCGSTYALQSQLTHHRQSVCTKRKCPDCGVRFANKSKLARHMRSHSGLKPFGCHLCGKAYGDRGSLNAHNASHEGAKPFVCDLCGRQYTHKGSFKSHMRTHTGDKPFQCDHCGTQFSFRSSLLCHIKTHTGERPYTCDICGKTFADRSVQLRHTRSHKGDKPYQCKECGKGFTQSGTLKIHRRKHTGDKPYGCSICHQSFICRSDLNKHSRSHSADHKPAVKRSKAAPAVVPVPTEEHVQLPVQMACQVTPCMSEVIEYTSQNMDYTTMTKMEATDSVKNLIILSSQVEEAGVQYVTNQLYRGNYVTMM